MDDGRHEHVRIQFGELRSSIFSSSYIGFLDFIGNVGCNAKGPDSAARLREVVKVEGNTHFIVKLMSGCAGANSVFSLFQFLSY